jgi:hypothetical protein
MRHSRDEGEGAARPRLVGGRRHFPREYRTKAKDDNFSRADEFFEPHWRPPVQVRT